VSPLRGEKPQNRPLSKRNTGRFALRAMLPVINNKVFAYHVVTIIVIQLTMHIVSRISQARGQIAGSQTAMKISLHNTTAQ